MGLQNSLHWLSESESPLLSLHSVIKTTAQRNWLVRPLHQHPHSHRSIYTKVQFCNDTGQIKLLCNLVNGKIELVPRMCFILNNIVCRGSRSWKEHPVRAEGVQLCLSAALITRLRDFLWFSVQSAYHAVKEVLHMMSCACRLRAVRHTGHNDHIQSLIGTLHRNYHYFFPAYNGCILLCGSVHTAEYSFNLKIVTKALKLIWCNTQYHPLDSHVFVESITSM